MGKKKNPPPVPPSGDELRGFPRWERGLLQVPGLFVSRRALNREQQVEEKVASW
jgi:hypothetical protein